MSQDKLEAAFRAFDKDGSNSISTDEIRNVLGVGETVSEAVWDEIIAEVDSNGDGNVDFDEFRTMMLRLMSKND